MRSIHINTANDVYDFINRLEAQCEESLEIDLQRQLEDAKRRGSSGLEIMGALREVILANIRLIGRLLGSEGEKEASLVVQFIDRAFGR